MMSHTLLMQFIWFSGISYEWPGCDSVYFVISVGIYVGVVVYIDACRRSSTLFLNQSGQFVKQLHVSGICLSV